jgi:hypothetical protein
LITSEQFPISVLPLCFPPSREWLLNPYTYTKTPLTPSVFHSQLPFFSSSFDVFYIEGKGDWLVEYVSISDDLLATLINAWIPFLQDEWSFYKLRERERDFIICCPGYSILDGNHRTYVSHQLNVLIFIFEFKGESFDLIPTRCFFDTGLFLRFPGQGRLELGKIFYISCKYSCSVVHARSSNQQYKYVFVSVIYIKL